jgi:hypothetical protein
MKGNGAETGNGSAVGSEGSVTHVDFNAEIARLKVLRAQASEKDFELALSRAAKRFDVPKSKLRKMGRGGRWGTGRCRRVGIVH